jgi:hypothetical protein
MNPDFKSIHWQLSYKTSTFATDGQPVNILHDFYIPALKRSVGYDRVAGYFRSSSLAAASQGFSAFTAQASFEALWRNEHPHLRVLTLPEAVRDKLIAFGRNIPRPLEIDGSSDLPPVVEPPSALERLQFAAVLRDAPPGCPVGASWACTRLPWSLGLTRRS